MTSRTARLVALAVVFLVVTFILYEIDWSGNESYFGWKDGHDEHGQNQQGSILGPMFNDAATYSDGSECNKMGPSGAQAATLGSKTGVVELHFLGRLGNNLFEYATARALADSLGWTLALTTAKGNPSKYGTLLRPDGMACFPGVRGLDAKASSPDIMELREVNFRGLEKELADHKPRRIIMQNWFQDYKLFSYYSDHLRKIMALEPSCCGSTAPGDNDLVIHYRNYRAELTEKQYNKLHFKDLDFQFYTQIIDDMGVSARPETIWIVGEFDERDPLMEHLKGQHDDVRKAEDVDGQFQAFCYLTRARRFVMAQSTFSWWAGYLGNATEIHFPLTQGNRGVTVPRVMVKEDERYVYRNHEGVVIEDP